MQKKPARLARRHPPRQKRAGMTLIEIVLAIAVAGFVLYASTAYVVSISNIWADREERHFFEDHVDGVTEFLKAAFLHAGYELALGENGETGTEGNNPEEPEQNSPKPKSPQLEKPEIKTPKEPNQQEASDDRSGGRSLISKSESPIAWKKPPGAAGYEDPMLHFSL
ncbi:MAG: prepilin-type N-terminal cleavage/methylation domain-containing protein, partial [Coraliomargarita sp.]